uniref:Ovule protein n=2 Tax=Bursaphelenchus xylophilus TaxID=6326 RepID=A0A1I7SNS1_BURXY
MPQLRPRTAPWPRLKPTTETTWNILLQDFTAYPKYPKCLPPIFHYEPKHHLHSRHTPFHLQHPSSPPTRTAPLLRSTPTTLLPYHTLFRIDLQAPYNGYL